MADRVPIFDAIRAARPDDKKQFMPDEVSLIDTLLDRLHVPREDTQLPAPAADGQLHCSAVGIALIQSFEQCHRLRSDGRLEAYPDPGRGWKLPTIGWGSTGSDVRQGTIWTREQCDARFAADVERFSAAVRRAIGATSTSQAQFDALVCFAYNCAGWEGSTLIKMHRARNYAGAAEQFGRWNKARDKHGVLLVLPGLTRRRAAEAALYRSGT